MKYLFTLYFLLVFFSSYAQKTKTIDVIDLKFIVIQGTIYYADDNTTPMDTMFFLIGRDDRFANSKEFIGIKVGHYKDIYSFVQKSLTTLKTEDAGTNIVVDRVSVDVKKSKSEANKNYLVIHSNDGISSGYTVLTKVQVDWLIMNMETYATKNKISLTLSNP